LRSWETSGDSESHQTWCHLLKPRLETPGTNRLRQQPAAVVFRRGSRRITTWTACLTLLLESYSDPSVCIIPPMPRCRLDALRRGLSPSASSEESCIRKAVAECVLTAGPGGLADTTAEDEAATGSAFAICRLNRWVRGASEAGYRPAAERGRRPKSSPSLARPEDSTA
jgi:hypothetical protein